MTPKKSRRASVRQSAFSLGQAVFVALVLRAFVVEAYVIPSGSMIPTLQVGDRIFVNKFSHGISIPFTDIKLGMGLHKPSRGEVVVFKHPKEDTTLIKRIVAVEGDVVETRDDVLYVNGVAAARKAIEGDCAFSDYDEGTDQWKRLACHEFSETIDGTTFTTLFEPGRTTPSFAPIKVPKDSFFVMGDHRDNSSDSRYWGFVPNHLIKGRALFVWWSYGEPDGVRFSRLFSAIH